MTGKLLNLLLLCNDINLKTLINVEIYDASHLLITCKSFVKRFYVEDRKQVNSWITKSWHPFTCGAVKDPVCDTLYAVINNVNLCKWSISNEEIEVSKRNIFVTPIHSLVSTLKCIYVVYSSGFIEKLDSAIHNRKEVKPMIFNEDEEILDVRVFTKEKVAALLVRNKAKELVLYKTRIESSNNVQNCVFHLNEHICTGYTLTSFGHLITTWSNGVLCSYNIKEDLKGTQQTPRIVKGQLNALNTTKRMRVLELSSNYIIIQGMKANQEGGILVLWDYKFGVPVSMKPLKMYRDPPLAYRVQQGAVVTDGGSLVYVKTDLSPSTVASMVGSRISDQSLGQEDSVVGLCISSNLDVNHVPLAATETVLSNKSIGLADAIQKVNYAGVSEDILLRMLIPRLIEEKNDKILKECLTAFKFIPEKCIIDILSYFLTLPDDAKSVNESVASLSKNSVKISSSKKKKSGSKAAKNVKNVTLDVSMTDDGQNVTDTSFGHNLSTSIVDNDKASECPFSAYKSGLINTVLCASFTDSELSVQMRHLNFKNSLCFLGYLHYLLKSGKSLCEQNCSSGFPSIERTSLWMSLVLDANYHQFIMTSEVEVQKKLLACFNDVITLYNITEASHTIEVLIERVLASKPLPLSQNNLPYSIETLAL